MDTGWRATHERRREPGRWRAGRTTMRGLEWMCGLRHAGPRPVWQGPQLKATVLETQTSPRASLGGPQRERTCTPIRHVRSTRLGSHHRRPTGVPAAQARPGSRVGSGARGHALGGPDDPQSQPSGAPGHCAPYSRCPALHRRWPGPHTPGRAWPLPAPRPEAESGQELGGSAQWQPPPRGSEKPRTEPEHPGRTKPMREGQAGAWGMAGQDPAGGLRSRAQTRQLAGRGRATSTGWAERGPGG